MLKRFFGKMKKEEGQGLVEYALIIVLVACVVMISLIALQVDIDAVFARIGGILNP